MQLNENIYTAVILPYLNLNCPPILARNEPTYSMEQSPS
jgi:hypothetical protein